MNPMVFNGWIDLPLSALVLAAFITNFAAWARCQPTEITVDLKARLPKARFRVVLLILACVFLCWFANISVWAVLALLVVLGFVLSLVLSGGDGSGVPFLLVAYAIREWSFGFPQLVLHPPADQSVEDQELNNALVGQEGTVTTPLRPFGDVSIGERVMSVVSEDGRHVDVGTCIVVCGMKNGRVKVRPVSVE